MNPFPPESAAARFDLLGVGVHATTYANAVATIVSAARAKRRCTVSALAVHGVMIGAGDPQHRARLNALDLITPDGQPVRWALNWLHGARLPDRVYGPFLMRDVCAEAEREGLSIFLYGSDERTLEALQARLRLKYPALRLAGVRPSRFRRATEVEWQEDIALLRASEADIIFCGLGCPRQETWAYEMGHHVHKPLLAVGAAFAFHAGTLSMAPAWMQRWGLEWAYRLSREPGRLWKRYLVYNTLFVFGVLRQRLSGGSKPSVRENPVPPVERWS